MQVLNRELDDDCSAVFSGRRGVRSTLQKLRGCFCDGRVVFYDRNESVCVLWGVGLLAALAVCLPLGSGNGTENDSTMSALEY